MNESRGKVMFEIYRDAADGRAYRVIYFTELDAHERDDEIERAMNGEHVFDGFLAAGDTAARRRIEELLARLNRGEPLDAAAIAAHLSGSLV